MRRCIFLSREWWESVLVDWNLTAMRGELSGLGEIVFEVAASDLDPVAVYFCEDGGGSVVDFVRPDALRLVAGIGIWRAFILGTLDGAEAVMTGKMAVFGMYQQLLPFVGAFSKLAKVAENHGVSEY